MPITKIQRDEIMSRAASWFSACAASGVEESMNVKDVEILLDQSMAAHDPSKPKTERAQLIDNIAWSEFENAAASGISIESFRRMGRRTLDEIVAQNGFSQFKKIADDLLAAQHRTIPKVGPLLALQQTVLMLEHYLDDEEMQEKIPWWEGARHLSRLIRNEIDRLE